MFLIQNDFLKFSIFRSFIFVVTSLITPQVLSLNHNDINQQRSNVKFPFANDLKNDSTNHKIKQLLVENNQIINRILSLRIQLSELEESIRLQEIYESIRDQEAINASTENLKRTIKRRSYLSLGIGLVSSSLILIGNDSDNNNIRYGGAILSLSIPVIAIISMKKQLNNLVPASDIDYSMLQSGSYPHNQASRSFFRNYVKAEIFALKAGIQRLHKINITCLNRLNTEKDWGYLKQVIDDTDYVIHHLEGYYVFRIRRFHDLIVNNYVTLPFDEGSRQKLQQISASIQKELDYLQKQQSLLLSNQKKINDYFE